MSNTSAEFEIGRDRGTGATNYFGNGGLCEYGLWKSRVLSSSDVTALHDLGNRITYSDLTAGLKTSLVAWYDGDEPSGNLIDDHTNGYDMTDNNGVGNRTGP